MGSYGLRRGCKKGVLFIWLFFIKLLVCVSIYAIGVKIAEKISSFVFTNSETGVYFIAFLFGFMWSEIHEFICKIIKKYGE